MAAVLPYNPVLAYNLDVIRELPRAWEVDRPPLLRSKLIFQEYSLGFSRRGARENVLVLHFADGKSHRTADTVVSIGSSSTNTVVFKHASISRRHAVILNFPNEVWIYDLESTCGTTLDGSRLNGRAFLDGVHDVSVGRIGFRVASNESLLL
jgi:hypothetical protein